MNNRRKWRRQRTLDKAVGESRREWLRVLRTDEWQDEIIVDSFAGGVGPVLELKRQLVAV